MTEEQRAQLLADWLKQPAGTDPPDGLDPDVVAAVYALRPDLAPRPRTTLDDILGSVKEGPFATGEPTTGEVVEFPRRAPPAPVEVEKSAPERRRPRRWRWMMPAVGGFLAAAAAAAIFIPVAGNLKSREPDLAVTESARMERPAAAPVIPEAAPTAPAPDAGSDAAAPAVGEVALARKAGPPPEERPADGAPGKRGEAPLEELGYLEQTGIVSQTGVAAGEGSVAPSGGYAGGYGAGGDLGAVQSAAPPAPATQAPAASAPPPPPEPLVAEAEEDLDYAEKSAAPLRERKDEAREQKLADDEARGARAPAAEPAAKPKSGRSSAANTVSKADVTTDTRAGAVPYDYDNDWYAGYPDVSAKYATAAMQEQGGKWAEAAAIYEGMTGDARVQVAQDAAYRAAKAWRNAGDPARALRAVDGGLRKSGANTPFRAQLLALRGDLLSQEGRQAEAARAWEEASELNADR